MTLDDDLGDTQPGLPVTSSLWSGKAVVAFGLGVAAVVFGSVPGIAGVLAAAAVVAAMLARRDLTASDRLRGFGISLAGLLCGVVVLVGALAPVLTALIVLPLQSLR